MSVGVHPKLKNVNILGFCGRLIRRRGLPELQARNT
jgi:hypothetical protein